MDEPGGRIGLALSGGGFRATLFHLGLYGGGRTWATIATLLQTAKMNDVNPLAWLTQTLERIAHRWPISQIDELIAKLIPTPAACVPLQDDAAAQAHVGRSVPSE